VNAGARGPSDRQRGQRGPSGPWPAYHASERTLAGQGDEPHEARERSEATDDPWMEPEASDFFRAEPDPPRPPRKPRPPRAVVLRQRRRRRRRIVVGTAVLSVFVMVTGSGYVFVRTRLDRIQRIPVSGLAPSRADGPLNTLLVISDTGEARVVTVLEADARRRSSAILSIPADNPLGGPEPIAGDSAAEVYARGGPAELVTALNERLGTALHHYAEMSVEELGTIVDVLGGVGVSGTGGGSCTRLGGDRAIDLLRAPGDATTIRRQADLIAGTMAGALAADPIGDFGRFRAILSDGAAEILFDSTLSNEDLTAMAEAFGNGETVLRTSGAAPEPEATASPPEPGDIRVQVLNGIRVDGAAARAAAALKGAGFVVSGTGGAGFPAFTTIVRYAPGKRRHAQVLASRLEAALVGEEDRGLGDADVTLVIGEDYAGLQPGAPREIESEATPAPTPTTTPPGRRTCS